VDASERGKRLQSIKSDGDAKNEADFFNRKSNPVRPSALQRRALHVASSFIVFLTVVQHHRVSVYGRMCGRFCPELEAT
jgi:hypothetical protein